MTPEVNIRDEYVKSHLRELPTYWAETSCPYENIDGDIIKNPVGDEEIMFNCLHEYYLMQKYFHKEHLNISAYV
jgi:hypothetical protein